MGINWQAQAFSTTETDVVNGAVTTHIVTIYDFVRWGFIIAVPEPSPLVLAAAFVPLGGFVYWWRNCRRVT